MTRGKSQTILEQLLCARNFSMGFIGNILYLIQTLRETCMISLTEEEAESWEVVIGRMIQLNFGRFLELDPETLTWQPMLLSSRLMIWMRRGQRRGCESKGSANGLCFFWFILKLKLRLHNIKMAWGSCPPPWNLPWENSTCSKRLFVMGSWASHSPIS